MDTILREGPLARTRYPCSVEPHSSQRTRLKRICITRNIPTVKEDSEKNTERNLSLFNNKLEAFVYNNLTKPQSTCIVNTQQVWSLDHTKSLLLKIMQMFQANKKWFNSVLSV